MRNFENIVQIPQKFHIVDVRSKAQEIKNIVEFRGFDRVIVDFKYAETCFAESVLPIIALIRKYRSEGVKFTLVPPALSRLQRLFLNCNWSHMIDPQNFEGSQYQGAVNIPALEFVDSTEQHQIVNLVMDKMLKLISYLDRSHLRALEWSVNEITDNVLVHAHSDVGGIIQLNLRPQAKEIEFIVSDAGMGVPNSLRDTLGGHWSDERILEEAIKEGVTRGTGQGNGLFGSYQICAVSGGSFHINSGNGYLCLTRNGKVLLRKEAVGFPGTSVVAAISYSQPLLLEKALRFKDSPHIPVDILELNYESDDDCISFSLGREASSIGSRFSGFEARTKLENIISMTKTNRVVIDMSGIGLMSSSFADEFFAKLMIRFGIEEFGARFELKHCTETNRNLIARSYSQRMGKIQK